MGAATDQSEHGPAAAWPRRACDGVVQHEAEHIIGQPHHDAARGSHASLRLARKSWRQERALADFSFLRHAQDKYAYVICHIYVSCTLICHMHPTLDTQTHAACSSIYSLTRVTSDQPETLPSRHYLPATPRPLKCLRTLVRCAVASWRARFAIASQAICSPQSSK